MDMKKLECFIAVAGHLHFGRAAEMLGIKQSVVSEAVQNLERSVGGRLFDRTSRRVSLTPLGEALLRDVSPAIDSVKAAMRDARRRAQGHQAEITVGYLGGGFYEMTASVIAEYRRIRPDITLRFVELSYLNQGSAVLEGKVDVALARLPLASHSLSCGSVLFQDARMLVVPSGHRLLAYDLVDPEELRFERMARLPRGTASEEWCNYHFPWSTPAGHPIADGPEISTVREGLVAVTAGQCVMTLTSRARQYFSHPGAEFIEIDLAPIRSALTWRTFDHRSSIRDLELAARAVAARLGTLVTSPP
ncbi:LysR family transcriptional regulator [Ochrobactrum sp. CM-21-5]|nr:LysR family transcriptional regulator [Ochrobactrum sp. CM-21-5]MBC2887123.1 LysR family transcriptional regulator [Ochrobactrum sp. CM-21-5]